ncbi:MAG: lysylphosphatidylglycerol synthase transmembrane domain-containing protein [Nanoarchaeota archaeon]
MKKSNLIKNNGFSIIIIIMITYVGIVLYSDINKISSIFYNIKYEFLVIIIGLQMISFSLRSYRQKKFLESSGIKLSFWENFKICLAGMSMIVTPGGAGMLIKSHFLKRKYGFSVSRTAPMILAERYHDFLAVTTILLLSLIVVFSIHVVISGTVALILLFLVYLIIRNHDWLEKFEQTIIRKKIFQKIFPSDLNISDSVNSLKTPRIIGFGWIISTILWIIDAFAIFFGFVALDVDIGVVESIQIFFSSLIYGIISFLPAGIGVTEGIFIGLLLKHDVKLSIATALILFIRLTTVWFLTFVGFVTMKFFLGNEKT